jgi:hypothetical protein
MEPPVCSALDHPDGDQAGDPARPARLVGENDDLVPSDRS